MHCCRNNLFLLGILLPITSYAVEVSTPAEFGDAVKAGGDVVLTDDLTLTALQQLLFITSSNLTIEGQGHTIDGGENQHQYLRFNRGSEVNEIKDITFQNIVNQVIPDDDEGNSLDPDDNFGGALVNMGNIEKIDANFTNNLAFNGGGIGNGQNAYIGSINGTFTGNRSGLDDDKVYESSGAAIFNQGHIGNITGYFEDNTASLHGTIWNYGTIDNITAEFVRNHRTAVGGNDGLVTITNSRFYQNDTKGKTYYTKDENGNLVASGNYGQSGAGIIYYGGAKFTVRDSVFEENNADWKGGAIAAVGGSGSLVVSGTKFINNTAREEGGAIFTASGTVDISDSEFTGNYGAWGGGAIYNRGGAYTIADSKFSANKGTAIANYSNMDISGSEITESTGTGIYSEGVLKIQDSIIKDNIGKGVSIGAGNAEIVNTDIMSNNKSGTGGAVNSLVDLTMAADGENMQIAGNNADTNQTGVFMETEDTTLNLNTANDGKLLFDDIVDGNDYNIKIGGDESGRVEFHNNINNLKTLTMAEGGTLYVAKDQKLNMQNLSGQNGTLWLDAETDYDNNTLKNGLLEVGEDVSGNTNVIVNFLNTAEAATPNDVLSPFVTAANDDKTTDASFKVSRVISSPYMWETRYNIKGDENGSVWYLGIQKKEEPVDPKPNPDPEPEPNPAKPDNFVYAPEIAAYAGVQSAAIEQNRGVVDSVARGLMSGKETSCCGSACNAVALKVKKKAWIDINMENSEIETPVDMEAKIQGTTLGLDLYSDGIHRSGVFGVYRHGQYDFSGKGEYYSLLGSDIRTDSYLGGAYYQYNRDDWRMLSTVFAGKQDMEIKTDDKAAFASTDAMQYGVNVDVAKVFALGEYLNLEPNFGLRYTMLDIDGLTDNVGKKADFDVLHFAQAELGVTLEYLFCREGCANRLYVKPSVIQTFVRGGKTRITGLKDEVKSLENQTLGRLEVGGKFGLSNNWSGYAEAGYTTGSDYNAYDVNLGLSYAF